MTWIELHLVAEAGGTRLTLTHVADIDDAFASMEAGRALRDLVVF